MSEVESNSESISKYPVGSALHHLESLLERRMRVKLSDGRVVEGDLQVFIFAIVLLLLVIPNPSIYCV